MALLDFFKQRKSNSASIAKERLQILVAHDRRGGGPSYLPQLQRDLLKVIRKYVAVDNDAAMLFRAQSNASGLFHLLPIMLVIGLAIRGRHIIEAISAGASRSKNCAMPPGLFDDSISKPWFSISSSSTDDAARTIVGMPFSMPNST